MHIPTSALFFTLSLVLEVLGQTTHTVTVGDEGSFYDPPSIAAGLNDVVNFIFAGLRQHGVTQSSLENPCSPLPGGFNSGFASLSNSTDPNEAPVWQLTVTNISAPIWYFCAVSHPVSHCGSGMVGAINPPSQDQFNAFVAAAKNSTTTITSALPYAATGVGAFAAETPILSSVGSQFLTATQSQSSTASTSTPTSSSSPSSTSTNNTSKSASDTGAIVGGAVGGAIGLGLLILAGVYLCLRHRRSRQTPPSEIYYQDYQPGIERVMEQRTHERSMSEGSMAKQEQTIRPLAMLQPSSSPPPTQHQHAPMGMRQFEESRLYAQPIDSPRHKTSFTVSNPDDSMNTGYISRSHSRPDFSPPGSERMSPPLPLPSPPPPMMTNASNHPHGKDINTLAKEVAAVLYQQQRSASGMAGSSGGQTMYMDEALQNPDNPFPWNKNMSVSDLEASQDPVSQNLRAYTTPPPHYRAN
ncbi:hypothetical protein GYMLUDRAFT_833834 [Collybiopsis luxurians FD-317 M1]|uniref:Extracellular serine-rich protein n=1 Tax=Collybiopsis luxurians FD-317 M1 TaxID=944289 RepID=A0A0D0C044_9AGAR|nr:hypothetical protein GYMLUDRAFT_833834 [Collybiopsis luxurians FD-317 M1]